MRYIDLSRAIERLDSIAAVARRWLRIVIRLFWVFRLPTPRWSSPYCAIARSIASQGMQGIFELVVIGFAQRRFKRAVQNLVQLYRFTSRWRRLSS